MRSLWIRAETLLNERRTALAPIDAQQLIQQGHQIFVERSPSRIFPDIDYLNAGCQLVDAGSYTQAPTCDYVLGIKALTEGEQAISQQHIYFAHAYKQQDGAKKLLERFSKGQGRLYDLEFLYDENRQRACYFGYWSGVAAASISLLQWCHKLSTIKSPMPTHFNSLESGLEAIEQKVASCDQHPRAIVIGYKGNCGRGVKSILKRFNIEVTLWDKENTKQRTSYQEVLQHDLFFNCIYLSKKIYPFITVEELQRCSDRQLSLICDIACDPDNPLNPIPIYTHTTSFDAPALSLNFQHKPLDIIAISNLPSFYPRESSNAFSAQLRPYLEQLLGQEKLPPAWKALDALFEQQISQPYSRAC